MENNVQTKVQEQIFDQILSHPENKVCADCPNKSPTWASIDFGVFLCLRCAGVHRQLGPHINRIRSAKLDSWNMENIEILAAVGNRIANNYWEYNVPSYFKKPDITTSMEDVRKIVDDKYIKRKYAPKDFQSPIEEFVEARKNNKITAGAFRQQKLTGNQYGSTADTTTPTTTNTSTTSNPISFQKVETKTKPTSQNLMDFDEGDNDDFGNFTSGPTKQELGNNFTVPSSSEQKTISSYNLMTLDFGGSTTSTMTTTTTQPEQKKKNIDAFQFMNNKSQQQQTQQSQPPTQQTNNSQGGTKQIDSSSLYNLYKTGNTIDLSNSNQTNTKNYQGGSSNYGYLDLMGSQSQQNQFNPYQQQKPQGYGQQTNAFGGGQSNGFGGYGYQNTQNNANSGFGGGFGSKTVSGGGFGGGFNGSNTTNSFGFQSTGTLGGFGSNNNGYYGVPQQQQSQQVFYSSSTTSSTTFTF